jgi:uncharacterized protein (DUF58 family)
VPTRNGAATAVAGVLLLAAAVLLGYPELAVFGFAALIALLVAGAWMLAQPRLGVRREIDPPRVTAGEEAVGVLTVTNRAAWRCPPISASDMLGARPAGVLVPSLAAHASHRSSYPLPTRDRGVFTVGPLTVEHTDPLRLMALPKHYAVASTLYVHPVVDVVRPLPIGPSLDHDGPTSSLSQQGGIAFHHLREYVHGDDHRLVHWKSSARTGRLMIRHNVVPNEPRMTVLLDTSMAAYEDDDTFEHAVRAAASWCVAALREGFPLRLLTTAREKIDAVGDGHERTAILDLLAAVRRTADDPGLAVLPALVPASDVVSLGVVTGRCSPAMLATLPLVRSRLQTVSLVQFTRAVEPPARLAGVTAVSVRGPAEFSTTWNGLVTR